MKTAKALWVLLGLIVLAGTLRGFDRRPNSDIEEVLAWTMLPLGFPLGLLFPAAIAGYATAHEATGHGPVLVTYLSLVVSVMPVHFEDRSGTEFERLYGPSWPSAARSESRT